MAFDPFAGFAKYRRFWMGLVMILVLITFVLCTGTRGDMQDILLRVFRFGGTPVASIDGTTYYRQDFDKLQLQRKVANDYMRLYAKLLIDSLTEQTRALGEPKEESQKKLFVAYQQLRQVLTERTKNPKFFGTGTRGEELVDFKIWLCEADRLGVQLTPNQVGVMIDSELFKPRIFDIEKSLQEWHVAPEFRPIEQKALLQVMRDHGGDRGVNNEFIFTAIMNEYRVRIAQLADCEFQLVSAGARTIKRINPSPYLKADLVRTPLSPGMLWDFYKDNRREFDVALLPLPVEMFAKDITEPNPKKLEELFEKYKKTAYDPASDTPGFQRPHQIRVQYASADMNGPFYKRIADVADSLAEYPIGSFVPQFPMATAFTFAAGSSMFDTVLDQQYFIKLYTERQANVDYHGGGILAMDYGTASAAYLARKDPAAIAAMVGAEARPDAVFAGLAAYLAQPTVKNAAMLERNRKEGAKAVFPLVATVVATALSSPLEALRQYDMLTAADPRTGTAAMPRRLPLDLVRAEILKSHQTNLTRKYVMANMAFLKKKLEDPNIAGKPAAVQRELDRWGPAKKDDDRDKAFRDLGLEIATTDGFHDKYTIKDAPELKPLLEAYAYYYGLVNQSEARDLRPDSLLKDDDFWKLFFDPSETFAIQSRYAARPWPPVVRLGSREQIEGMLQHAQMTRQSLPDLDYEDMKKQADTRDAARGGEAVYNLFGTSERPFLFWKTEEKLAESPESLEKIKAQVLAAYKKIEARDTKVLPVAKTIAQGLLKGGADYASVLRLEGSKFGQTPINLQDLAPFYRNRSQEAYVYDTFKLPRGVIPHPRDDTVAQLFKLIDLKEPIVIDVPDVDKLNKELFDEAQKKGLSGDKHVQVLANKSRDMYYLAVVAADHGVSRQVFFDVLRGAARNQDTFFDRAQDKLGETHYREMIRQLREDHRVTVHDEAKKYDNDPGN